MILLVGLVACSLLAPDDTGAPPADTDSDDTDGFSFFDDTDPVGPDTDTDVGVVSLSQLCRPAAPFLGVADEAYPSDQILLVSDYVPRGNSELAEVTVVGSRGQRAFLLPLQTRQPFADSVVQLPSVTPYALDQLTPGRWVNESIGLEIQVVSKRHDPEIFGVVRGSARFLDVREEVVGLCEEGKGELVLVDVDLPAADPGYTVEVLADDRIVEIYELGRSTRSEVLRLGLEQRRDARELCLTARTRAPNGTVAHFAELDCLDVGCGCRTSPSPAAAWGALAVALLGLGRRRRRTC